MMILLIIPFSTIIISASAENLDQNLTKVSFGSLWLPRSFRILCCLSGYPVPKNPKIIRNWTHEESDYITDEYSAENAVFSANNNSNIGSLIEDTAREKVIDSKCRIYHGSYLLSTSTLFTFDEFTSIGVVCKCPEVPMHENLDQSCRRLKRCQNNGYRPLGSNSHCVCPEPYFGAQCEKYCDQGQRLKGLNGNDYCSCTPFYQGEECRNIVCLNGGTVSQHQCICPTNFLGYHCEIDANRTSLMLRFHGYREQNIYHDNDLLTRDISSTIFSLVMIAVLVLSMYLLMKHRMQVQNRFITVRREALLRSGIEISSTRGNMTVPEDPTVPSFRTTIFPNEGPPPYIVNSHRRRSSQRDNLPPLPTYEDATKLPPFIRPQLADERGPEEEENVTHNNTSTNELQSNEGDTETHTSYESPILHLLSYQPESQHSLETVDVSVSDERSIQMQNNAYVVFNKNSLIRKSV